MRQTPPAQEASPAAVTARDQIERLGYEELPVAHPGNARLAAILQKHVPAILTSESVVVPDDEEEMLWRLFFAHSQDMQGFRADIFTGGWNEAKNPVDPHFVGLRDRWQACGGDGKSMVAGLAALWENAEAQTLLKHFSNPQRPAEERAQGIAPAMALLSGPLGNKATRVFAQTLEDLKGPKISRKTNRMIRAYIQNSALLASQCEGSFRRYLESVVPEVYLPKVDLVRAERQWRSAIVRDFYNVGVPLASYLIADWLLGLWRDGQIEWFESYKEDSVFLKAIASQGLIPPEATRDFVGYCRTLRLPADWIPASLWHLAFCNLPPRVVNEAIWLEFNQSSGEPVATEQRVVPPQTDSAAWPRRQWHFPPYKSAAFHTWVEAHGGLDSFKKSAAYDWAVESKLIAGDEWSAEVAALPGLVEWESQEETPAVTERVNTWLAMIGAPLYPTGYLSRLGSLLSEAEFDPADTAGADPMVLVPLAQPLIPGEEEMVSLQIRLLPWGRGKHALGVFTTRERLEQFARGEDLAWVTLFLSEVGRMLAAQIREGVPLEVILLNPGQPNALQVPHAVVERLAGSTLGSGSTTSSGGTLLQEEKLDTGKILAFFSPSTCLPDALWESVCQAIQESAGGIVVKTVWVEFVDLSQSLWICVPSRDKKLMGRIWSAVDRVAGGQLPDWVLLSLLDAGIESICNTWGAEASKLKRAIIQHDERDPSLTNHIESEQGESKRLSPNPGVKKMDPSTVNTAIGIVASGVSILAGVTALAQASKSKKSKEGVSVAPKSNTRDVAVASKSSTKTSPSIETVGREVKGVLSFTNDDAAYKKWIEENKAGFVINANRKPNASYLPLHRATCSHVSNFASHEPGAFTEKDYIKICSTDLDSLREWVKAHGRADGSFTGNCPCKPLATTTSV